MGVAPRFSLMSDDPSAGGAQSADRMMADALEPLRMEAERVIGITGLPDDERVWVKGFHGRVVLVVGRLRECGEGRKEGTTA